MVLPIILAGTAVSAIFSAVKALGASEKKEVAKGIVAEAENRHKAALAVIEERRKEVQEALSRLGLQKIEIESKQLSDFAQTYGEIQRHALRRVGDNREIIPITRQELNKIQLEGEKSAELIATGVTALTAGVTTVAGATGLIGAFGAASSGTAISALGGAAASNATLAWLGGGSLAAGGAGVAGGMMALGGLVAAPAFLVMGFAAASNAEKMLTQAVEYKETVDKYIVQFERGMVYLTAVEDKVKGVSEALVVIAASIIPVIESAKTMIGRKTVEYAQLSWVDKNIKRINPLNFKQFTRFECDIFESLNHHGMLLYALVKVPVFYQGDKLNPELDEVLTLVPSIKESSQEYPVLSSAEFSKLNRVLEEFWRRSGITKDKRKTHWLVKLFGLILLLFIALVVIGVLSEKDEKTQEPVQAQSMETNDTSLGEMDQTDYSNQTNSIEPTDSSQPINDAEQPMDATAVDQPISKEEVKPEVFGEWQGELYDGQGKMKIVKEGDNYLANLEVQGKGGCTGQINDIVGRFNINNDLAFNRIVNAEQNLECSIVVTLRDDKASIMEFGCESFHGSNCSFNGSIVRVVK